MNLSDRLHRILTAMLALAAAVLLFAQPALCRRAAVQALALCGRQLLPALFPFLVISTLLVQCGAAQALGLLLTPAARLIGLRGRGTAGVLLIGLLGGFAPAACAAAELYRRGGVTARDSARLLPACIASAPSFVVLGVGGMLGSVRLGWVLYGCQTAAGLLAACLTDRLLYPAAASRCSAPAMPETQSATNEFPAASHNFSEALPKGCGASAEKHSPSLKFSAASHNLNESLPKSCGTSAERRAAAPEKYPAASPTLDGAIRTAAAAFLSLCGFVVFFCILAQGAAAALPARWRILPAVLLEISTGCAQAARSGRYAVYWCCAALSLESLSVLLQVRALLPAEISLRPLLWSRLFHLPASLLLLRLALSAGFGGTAEAYSSLAARVIVRHRLPPDACILFFFFCCLTAARLSRPLQPRENPL